MNVWDTQDLPEKNSFGQTNFFELHPGDFVLALTHETITIPKHLIGLVEGRSTGELRRDGRSALE